MGEVGEIGVQTIQKTEKSNPVCSEVLNSAESLGVPLNMQVSELLNEGNTRYGNGFALASGKVIRALAENGAESDAVYSEIFGIDTNKEYDDIEKYVLEQEPDLSDEDRRKVVLEELSEVSVDPKVFYNLDRIKKDKPNFENNGAELFWGFLEEAVTSEKGLGVEIPFKESVKWGNCKDSEYYMASTLPEGSMGRNAGARCVVYVDEENKPVIYQKSGEYKIEINEEFSNATAINLVPITVNGVTLPPGTLLGISGELDKSDLKKPEDQVVPLKKIQGVFPLRLTAFSLPREDAKLAFAEHYTNFSVSYGKQTPELQDFEKAAIDVVAKK